MDLRPSPHHPRAAAARFAVPLAAGAAMASFAAHQTDPQAAAETGYLAVLATALLLCLTGAELAAPRLGGGRLPVLGVPGVAAVLVVLILWVLPAGPVRGASLALLAAAALALTGTRGLVAAARREHPFWPRLLDHLTLFLPLAVGIQVLVRSERLLEPALDLRLVAGLVGLPAVAAGATALLAHRHGAGPAAVAAAVAGVLGPGFTTVTAGALAALALAELAWRPGSATRRAGSAVRGAALAGLAVTLGVQAARAPAAAVVSAALALALGPAPRWAAAAAAVAATTLLLAPGAGGAAVAERLALAVVLVPSFPAVVVAGAGRGSRLAALAALAAAAVAVVAGAGAGAADLLAAPLALVVLLATPAGHDERSTALPPQAVWSGLLLVTVALAAAYPWLRREPLGDALAVFGLARPGAAAAVAAVALWAVTAAAPRPARRGASWPPRPRAAAAAAALAAGALLLALPPPRQAAVMPAPVSLDATSPRAVLDLDGAAPAAAGAHAVRSLVVDSNLSHAIGVTQRTPVATVHLLDGAGGDAQWVLRAGEETAEWAARRPDVAAASLHRPPPPWLAWVAPGGSFFGLTFRSRWRLATPVAARQIVVERDPDLPPETVIHLHRVEARR